MIKYSSLWLLIGFVGSPHHALSPNSLPLCDKDNVFSGSWTFHQPHFTRSRAYSSCPKTLGNVSRHPFLHEHIRKYSCPNVSVSSARYNPVSCRTIQPAMASHVLTQANAYITLVGDSLMAQLYISLLCLAEQYYFPSEHIKLVSDLYLRPDIPCADQCIANATFLRLAGDDLIGNPCLACRSGKKTLFDDTFSTSSSGSWPSQIPPKTTVLIIGVGAWYHNAVNESIELYKEMLKRVGQVLGKLKKERGVLVFWHDLPPMSMFEATEPEKYQTFGWNTWSLYNTYAKEILSPHGVIFLNTSKATLVRKLHDPSIVSDYVHWCNPGRDTIPQFVANALLHLISVPHVHNVVKLNNISQF